MEPPTKPTVTPISNPVKSEMENRRYANSPDSANSHPMEREIKSSMRKEYEQKDKDLKNTMDKSLMKSKIKYLEGREQKLGGSAAVTKKIKTKEKVNKALPWVAGSSVVAGVGKMIFDEIQRQKKVEK